MYQSSAYWTAVHTQPITANGASSSGRAVKAANGG
jgi:hypothetical protein